MAQGEEETMKPTYYIDFSEADRDMFAWLSEARVLEDAPDGKLEDFSDGDMDCVEFMRGGKHGQAR